MHSEDDIGSKETCLDTCKVTSGCLWFTFIPSIKMCLLFGNCDEVIGGSCDDCISGESRCRYEEEDGKVRLSNVLSMIPFILVIGIKAKLT